MRISFHEPLVFLLLHGALLFVARPLFVYFKEYSSIIPSFAWNVDYTASFLMGIFSFGLFIVFYVLGRRRTKGLIFTEANYQKINTSKYEIRNGYLAIGLFLGVCVVYWVFGDFIFGLIFGDASVNRSGNASVAFTYLNTYFFSIISISIICFDTLGRVNKFLIFVIMLPLLIGVGLFSGSKTLVLTPALLFLFHHSVKRGGVSLVAVFMVFLTLLLIIPISDSVRHNSQVVYGSILMEGIYSLLSRSYGTDVLHQILHHHLHGQGYLWGESFALLAVVWIPRIIWEDKPIISFGIYVSETYLPDVFAYKGISAAPTIIGQLFANFSFFSFLLLPVVAFFMGTLVRICLKKSPKTLIPLTWLSIGFSTLIFSQEASLSSLIVTFVVLFIISSLTYACFVKKKA